MLISLPSQPLSMSSFKVDNVEYPHWATKSHLSMPSLKVQHAHWATK